MSRRFLLVLIIALMITLVVTAFYAISNIVVEQNQIQQQSVKPVYELVNQELLKPLYIAESFAESIDFNNTIDVSSPAKGAILKKLKKMETQFGFGVFLALEKTRLQYMSDGRVFELAEDKVLWYFDAKENDIDMMADIGQAGNIHLFFDVKITGDNGEFLGYAGVSKPIQTFLNKFDKYKEQFGYDFLFVDNQNEIALTSFSDLIVVDKYATSLTNLEGLSKPSLDINNLDAEKVDIRGKDYMISEFAIKELNWRLLLLTPLEKQRATITRTLLINLSMTFAVIFVILAAVYALFLQYKFRIESSSLVDSLTNLANRDFLQRQYLRFRKVPAMLCVVVCDLDKFKSINDNYGHNIGDEVLKRAARVLKNQIRDSDTLGRWGGEEFVILVPAKSSDMGEIIAERARRELAKIDIQIDGKNINITASFGVSFGCAEQPFEKLVGVADAALYRAKNEGRNRVVVHPIICN